MKNVNSSHQEIWTKLNELKARSRLPTAMAFVGPEGIGKSELADRLARELGCSEESGSFISVEPSGEWIKVDQIHDLIKTLSLQSLRDHRFVLLRQAEKLNAQSSNALLKILEEPPEKTHFILLTSNFSHLLPTVRSRVQSFRFHPLSLEQLREQAPEAPDWALHLSRGQKTELEEWLSEDATQLLSQARVFLHALGQKDLETWLQILPLVKERATAYSLVKIFQFFFRDLVQDSPEPDQSLPFLSELKDSFHFSIEKRMKGWKKAFELEVGLRQNADRSLLFQNYFYVFHGHERVR